jgi:hypothetical protein
MTTIVIFQAATGEIVRVVSMPAGLFCSQTLGPGEMQISVDQDVRPDRHRVDLSVFPYEIRNKTDA